MLSQGSYFTLTFIYDYIKFTYIQSNKTNIIIGKSNSIFYFFKIKRSKFGFMLDCNLYLTCIKQLYITPPTKNEN